MTKGDDKNEKVLVCSLDDTEKDFAMDRKEFYDEQIAVFKKTGKPTKAISIVDVFLMNSDGEVIVQKRSHEKRHNPGVFDKSVGGHVRFGDTPDYTAMVETIQELQTPSIVLNNNEDFTKAFRTLKDYLDTTAVMKFADSFVFSPTKNIDGENVTIANKVYIYFGIYNGRTRPVDREAKGVLYYTIDELAEEMKNTPNLFAPEMHDFKKNVFPDLEKFIASAQKL